MIKKLISLVLTLFLVTVISFCLFNLIPGNAARSSLGIDATEEQIEALMEAYGYNGSLPERFGRWFTGMLRGDFGVSSAYGPMRVSELISDRLVVTLILAIQSIVLIVLFSIPLGLICAARPGGVLDRISDWVTEIYMAIPSFVQGMLVTLLMGLTLHLFKPGGFISPKENLYECLKFMFYPALSVALPKIAQTVRFMKSAVKGELGSDYVRTARAKGCTNGRVMTQHVLKNSLLPVITFIGLIVAEVMAGSIMIEQVFNLPGMGRLLVTSISNRDFNVVQAIVIYIAACVITVNFLTDIIYKAVDPRM